jgi:aspartate/methionine/tyrosine aminotransferase
MNESPGFIIGLKDVYDEVRSLKDSMTAYTAGQDLAIQALDHRITELEKDRIEREKERQDNAVARVTVRRLVWTAVVTSLIFPIIVGIVVALIVKGS